MLAVSGLNLASCNQALDDANAAAGANGLNVTLDAQLVADVKAIAPSVKAAVPVSAAK